MAALQETFRVRVAKSFKRRFERVAARERRKPSDLGRLILTDYVEQREKQTKAAA